MVSHSAIISSDVKRTRGRVQDMLYSNSKLAESVLSLAYLNITLSSTTTIKSPSLVSHFGTQGFLQTCSSLPPLFPSSRQGRTCDLASSPTEDPLCSAPVMMWMCVYQSRICYNHSVCARVSVSGLAFAMDKVDGG